MRRALNWLVFFISGLFGVMLIWASAMTAPEIGWRDVYFYGGLICFGIAALSGFISLFSTSRY